MSRRTPRYTALFDFDDYPLATLHSDRPYLCVSVLPEHLHHVLGHLACTEHLTPSGAKRAQRRMTAYRGIAVYFNGITGRWEAL